MSNSAMSCGESDTDTADSDLGPAGACPHELSTACRPVSTNACLLAMNVRLGRFATCLPLFDCG